MGEEAAGAGAGPGGRRGGREGGAAPGAEDREGGGAGPRRAASRVLFCPILESPAAPPPARGQPCRTHGLGGGLGVAGEAGRVVVAGRDVPPSGKPEEGAARGGGPAGGRVGPEEKTKRPGRWRRSRQPRGGGPRLLPAGSPWPGPQRPGAAGRAAASASPRALITSAQPSSRNGQRRAGAGARIWGGASEGSRLVSAPPSVRRLAAGPRLVSGLSFLLGGIGRSPPRSWCQRLGTACIISASACEGG